MIGQYKQPCDEGVIQSAPEPKSDETSPGKSKFSGTWILIATILGSSITFIDGTVVNVTLPVLQESLKTDTSQGQWVIESYALAISSLLLVGGALGDKFGRKRIFNLGIVIFTCSSVVCGFAPNINWLIFARAVQGIGAALLIPESLAIISASFDKKSRSKAVGTWAGFTAIAAGTGPILGGWLVDNVSWRWIFLINVPFAVVILLISYRYVPETRDEQEANQKLDLTGALLAAAGLGGLVYGLTESNKFGLNSPQVYLSLLAGSLALAGFIFVERRTKNPMMPLGLFKSKTFAGANLLTFFLYAALNGILFFLPFNLIQIRGYSATEAGSALLPLVMTMFFLSRPASTLVDRFGARVPLAAGPVTAAIGFGLFSAAGTGPSNYWFDFFPAIVVMGLGMTISAAPLTTTVMDAVEERHAGLASGINNAVSRTAAVLAIAIFGIVMLEVFNYTLSLRMNEYGLEPAAQTMLNEQRLNLGSAKLSDDFDEKTKLTAKQIVNESFIAGFRFVALGAAGLALASGISGLLFIQGKAPDENQIAK